MNARGSMSIAGSMGRRLAAIILFVVGTAAQAAPVALQGINYSVPTATRSEVKLTFSGPAPKATTFTTDNPARLAVDLPDTVPGDIPKTQNFSKGLVSGVQIIQSGDRTRVVLGLTRVLPVDVKTQGNSITLVLSSAADGGARIIPGISGGERSQVSNIDFRRVDKGAGRVTVTLSNPAMVIDLQQRGDKLVADFIDARVGPGMERRLDVMDFATPVQTIDTFNKEGNARIVITPEGDYEHLAYQIGNLYTIEVKPLTKAQIEAAKQGQYSGERLSLNFQNIDVRAVLQLIGDFTGLNIVASDTVEGTVTLRLKNVPWDQALEVILKSKGLGMRKNGNVVMIAPSEEIAAREKVELESRQQVEDLSPLRTEFFRINYAKAADIAKLMKGTEGHSLLTKRGNVSVDERTNTLMVVETGDKLEEVRGVIAKLDIPVRQVLIESRIVIANDDFSREIGARFGTTHVAKVGDTGIATTTGSAVGNDTVLNSALNNINTTGAAIPGVSPPALNDRFNVNLPVINPAGRVALAILGADYIVDLELSAMQSEGKGEVVSSPRVVTANQKKALIEQGVDIPYLEASSSGATSVTFKKAVLSLGVTPQITPDDRVIMDVEVNKDSVGQIFVGIPSINRRAVNTQILVDNGDTVVLGGVYEHERRDEVSKVPLLGDIPILGALFRTTNKVDNKAELLIFITPKILKEGLRATVDE